jgi:hypothetical protein
MLHKYSVAKIINFIEDGKVIECRGFQNSFCIHTTASARQNSHLLPFPVKKKLTGIGGNGSTVLIGEIYCKC